MGAAPDFPGDRPADERWVKLDPRLFQDVSIGLVTFLGIGVALGTPQKSQAPAAVHADQVLDRAPHALIAINCHEGYAGQ